jgi:serine-aspartate repeat-containing protein C/D/E
MRNSLFATLGSLVLRLASSRSPRLAKTKYRRRRTLFAPETLEQRSLMAGDFAGTVFNDLNTNGINDSSDPGLAGWTVFVDSNNDGVLSASEPRTVTDVKGKFSIIGIPAGDVNIYEVVPAGFKPGLGFTDHKLISIRDGRVVKADYPNVTAPITKGDIAGTTFDDLNLNGIKDPSEHGLSGWTMFVDTNGDSIFNASELSTITDVDGDFLLVGVPAGITKVFEIPQGGYGPVSSGLFPLDTAVNFRQVNVVANSSVRAEFPNGITPVGTIQGNVWNDSNGDGIRQATEAALVGRSVFVDLDSNGVQDTTDPVRLTDANGAYSFVNIRSGSYRVIDVLAAGFIA